VRSGVKPVAAAAEATTVRELIDFELSSRASFAGAYC
jgi:hypothetical protein